MMPASLLSKLHAPIASALLVGFAWSTWVAQAYGADAERLQYNRDIRPILADHCFSCHGPDSASRKADLRLDKSDAAVAMKAIVPGDPAASELIKRIELPESDEAAMPPATGHKRLTDVQRKTLRRWIQEGAEYQLHWSFLPPSRPGLPEVKAKEWVRNPIDQFVLAELERRGLTPAPEADRRTLARRVSLDLTGLPPTPEAVEAFVQDPSPDAYEHYIESLFNSPRWGEHRGRHWLDYARYADTHGIHFDNFREVWAYRDWVIEAFNRNLPFDQFTIEQLAGDLLPEPTLDQKIATGFNRCNITTNEGGIIDEEYKVLYARDRTETTAAVWMGLTAGCAVCHDHKFDALTMHDFYSMSAFFNNTTQPVRDGNVQNTPPIIPVPRKEDRDRWNALEPLIAAAKKSVEEKRGIAREAFNQQPHAVDPIKVFNELPQDGLITHGLLNEGAGPATAWTVQGKTRLVATAENLSWDTGHVAPNALAISDKAILEMSDVGDFESDKSFSYAAWVWLPKGKRTGAVIARMDDQNGFPGWDLWIENNRVGTHIIERYPDAGKWIKVLTKGELPVEKWQHVAITYDGSRKASGVKIYVNGELRTDRDEPGKQLTGSIHTTVPFKVGQRHSSSALPGVRVQDVRLYNKQLSQAECGQLSTATRIAWLAARGAKPSGPDLDELFAWWLQSNAPEVREASESLAKLEQEKEAIRSRGTIAHIMTERGEAPEAFILNRGEYDQRRDRVTPDTPKALPPLPEALPRNRLGLAKWLLSPEHPLTARVTVNRFWQEVFGTGIVPTSGDFGVTGQLPSHPELLDWLALEFREKGWDVKQFFRLIVMSNTYRQASVATPEKLAQDPSNQYLSRGPRFRMDAEMVRDYALASSGILSPTIGGASVKPYQPEGVWEAVAMIGSNTRNYKSDKGESLYRRSMYTFWKRSAPPASMDIMNAPSRETCTVRRDRTNTPLQALVTLNDPQFVEAGRFLADHAFKSSNDDTARIQFMASRLLARPLNDDELKIVLNSLAELNKFYESSPEDAKRLIEVGESRSDGSIPAPALAALTMVANQLMNLDEVLNK